MTYEETCQYLFKQTNFETQGKVGYKEGLETTKALDEHFGHPHRKYKTIHIGGTNGKGSCSHTIAAMLQVCGYKVGLYTSPHLVDFRERIRINGRPLPEDYVVNFVEQSRNFWEPLKPSFFEITTAMAFKYFADNDVDIAVIEVGLGGRLDCTNIITPIASVITNISLDHQQLLGNTLGQIAMEKAGIIKKGIPVVIGETTPETRLVFDTMAKEMEAPIVFADENNKILSYQLLTEKGIEYNTLQGIKFKAELGGEYQVKNTNTILHVIRLLEQQGYLCDSEIETNKPLVKKEIEEAFTQVSRLTGLQGRWQIIRTKPLVICDTGHNVGGWQYLSKQIKETPHNHLHIVFGMVDDKDIYGVMTLLPKDATYYYTKADNKRALSEQSIKIFGEQLGLQGETYPTVKDAYTAALNAATKDDFIFVGGSSYVVGDFLKSRI